MNLTKVGSKNAHRFTLSVVEQPITQDNLINNNSQIKYTFIITKTTDVPHRWKNYPGVNYTIGIGDNQISGSIPSFYDVTTNFIIKSGTLTIPHESNGTKLLNIAFDVTDNTGFQYACGNASADGQYQLSSLHKRPELTIGTIEELDYRLDNKLYNNLSQKKINFSYETYDDATITNAIVKLNGVAVQTLLHLGDTNYFILDLKSMPINETYQTLSISISLIDNLNAISDEQIIAYNEQNYIDYQKPNIIQTNSNVKRNGQTSGEVKLNLQASFYNAIINNTQNASNLTFKYWKINEDEPVDEFVIINSAYTINQNNLEISDWIISKIINDESIIVNDFDKNFQYNVKIVITDSFNNSFDYTLKVKLGEYLIAKFKDRVDFKNATINHKEIATKEYSDRVVESGSNENGEWIKFKNGWMICKGIISDTVVGGHTTLSNGWYVSSVKLVNFSQEFIEPPNISTNAERLAGDTTGITMFTRGITNTSFSVWSGLQVSSASTGWKRTYVAFGRWK